MQAMTDRQRFLATMHYQDRDRGPICDFGFWPETIHTWHKQGLPDHVGGGHDTTHTDEFFGMDRYGGGPGAAIGLCPTFKPQVVENRGEQEVFRNKEGVLLLRDKYSGSIPIHLDHTLKDRESWEKHFKWRLDPDNPDRYPDWDAAKRAWDDEDHPVPRTIGGGSLFGWIRNWMGLENVAYLVHDDPGLFEEMVETITTLVVEVHRRCFEHGARFDAAQMWEDMCYNAGPLLGVPEFKQYLVPRYKRITDQLRENGCDLVWLDCDGKDLRMMGGFDKHILATTPAAITAEVERLTPLVEAGGYIPFADHRVPPDVPLANYMHYLREARHHWGKDHPSLKPMGELVMA